MLVGAPAAPPPTFDSGAARARSALSTSTQSEHKGRFERAFPPQLPQAGVVQRWTSSILMLSVVLMTAWATGSFANTHPRRAATVLRSYQPSSRVLYPDALLLEPAEPAASPPSVPPPAAGPAQPAPPTPASSASAKAPVVSKGDLQAPSLDNHSELGGGWACIRQKESSNNYQARSGPYYGAYQFDRGTWVSNGGDPNTYGNASPAEQDRVAQTTQSRRGWSPWPATSRMCHLR